MKKDKIKEKKNINQESWDLFNSIYKEVEPLLEAQIEIERKSKWTIAWD